MGDQAQARRSIVGAAARLWASPEHLEVAPNWWIALSGEHGVAYNVAFTQSGDPAVLSEQCLAPILELGCPATIMLAGPGLAVAQALADVGWVCVGAPPLMGLRPPIEPVGRDAAVRELTVDEVPLARELVRETYGLDGASSSAAVPDHAATSPDMAVWGLFDAGRLVSCTTTVLEQGQVVVWSMATAKASRRRGYGRRLLLGALAAHFGDGATGSLLHASTMAEGLYRSLGFETLEHWQTWSRPRWVFGRA